MIGLLDTLANDWHCDVICIQEINETWLKMFSEYLGYKWARNYLKMNLTAVFVSIENLSSNQAPSNFAGEEYRYFPLADRSHLKRHWRRFNKETFFFAGLNLHPKLPPTKSRPPFPVLNNPATSRGTCLHLYPSNFAGYMFAPLPQQLRGVNILLWGQGV